VFDLGGKGAVGRSSPMTHEYVLVVKPIQNSLSYAKSKPHIRGPKIY
jgi:hypothetical protein